MMPEAELPQTATVLALQAWGRDRLTGPEARRESELLLGHALQRARAWLFAHADAEIEVVAVQRFVALVNERARGVPVAQLLGEWGFWTLTLRITPDVLIPRPETELLVEAALERLSPAETLRIADLGTGSGAIALALASERPQAQVVATDLSPAALALARENARRHALHNVEFRPGHWCDALHEERFDLIASNPPYLADDDPHLTEGDLRFEPPQALRCGPSGLEALRGIVAAAPAHLHDGGWLLLEHGLTQGAAVRELLRVAGFDAIETRCDLEARERMTSGRWPGASRPTRDGALSA